MVVHLLFAIMRRTFRLFLVIQVCVLESTGFPEVASAVLQLLYPIWWALASPLDRYVFCTGLLYTTVIWLLRASSPEALHFKCSAFGVQIAPQIIPPVGPNVPFWTFLFFLGALHLIRGATSGAFRRIVAPRIRCSAPGRPTWFKISINWTNFVDQLDSRVRTN